MGTLFFLLFFACFGTACWLVIAPMIKRSGYDGDKDAPFNLFGIGATLAAAALTFLLFMAFTTVDTGSRAVVTKFGQVTRTLDPGPHLIMPFAEAVHPVSVQTLTVKPSASSSSRDLQLVHTQVTLAYHFDPSYVGYIYSQLSDASENAVENKVIDPAILEAVKACTAQYDAQSLITQRPAVRDGIEVFVKERLSRYHIVAENVSITDFNFSEEFNKSIEAKVTAQQNAEKAQNDLTRIKVEAEQKIAQAQAEAKSLEVQRQQITPELLQLRTIEMLNNKWDGQLPSVVVSGSGGAIPMLDVLKAAGKTK